MTVFMLVSVNVSVEVRREVSVSREVSTVLIKLLPTLLTL